MDLLAHWALNLAIMFAWWAAADAIKIHYRGGTI